MYIVRASVKIGATEPRFFEQALKYFRQAAGIFIFNSNNVTLYLFWQTKAKSYGRLQSPTTAFLKPTSFKMTFKTK